MQNNTFTAKVTIKNQRFYNEDSMFGIYTCVPLDYNPELEYVYGKVSIQGETRRLAEEGEYTITIEGAHHHPKYGAFYKIVEVEAEQLDSVQAQDNFLRAILTENQFRILKEAYPDEMLVDLIMNDKIDTSKTKGIKEKGMAKIKRDVEANAGISVLIAKLNHLNLTTSKIDRIMAHYGSSQKAVEEIENNIYSLCEISHFGFITVDKVALKRGDDPSSRQRITAGIDYILKQANSSGHSWCDRIELLEEAMELLNLESSLILDTITDERYRHKYFINSDKIAFLHVFKKEKEIYEQLKRIRDSYNMPSIERVKGNLYIIEKQQGFSYTEEQRNSIIEGSQHGVMILNGIAGSGKSTTISGLIDSLDESMAISCALSGKAVNVLSLRGIEASTIHRLLQYDYLTKGFLYNENNPLPYKLVVIDEMSMVNVELTLSVLKAIPNGTKLIIAGDSGQLSCIGYGDVLHDLLTTKEFAKFELTKAHRQAEKSGILSLANSVRDGNQIVPHGYVGTQKFGELQDQTVISYGYKEELFPAIMHVVAQMAKRVTTPEELLGFQVLVSNRERGDLSVRNLNIEMQKIFNNPEHKTTLSRNGYTYAVGDKIIAQGNSYDIPIYDNLDDYRNQQNMKGVYYEEDEDEYNGRTTSVFNGSMGHIVHIDHREKIAFFKFEGSTGIVPMNQNDLDKVELAYAISVHKSQGSSFKNLLCAFDFTSYMLLSKQLVYTALTRASDRCLLMFENKAMSHAINVDISATRRTFLGDIIEGVYDVVE